MILPYNKIGSKINSILARLHNPLAPAPTIFKCALWISTLLLLREKLAKGEPCQRLGTSNSQLGCTVPDSQCKVKSCVVSFFPPFSPSYRVVPSLPHFHDLFLGLFPFPVVSGSPFQFGSYLSTFVFIHYFRNFSIWELHISTY